MCDVLNDHIDVDVGIGQRAKDIRYSARPVGHAGERHLGFVLVVGNARDQLAFHFVFSDVVVADDKRACDGIVCGSGKEQQSYLHPFFWSQEQGKQHTADQ